MKRLDLITVSLEGKGGRMPKVAYTSGESRDRAVQVSVRTLETASALETLPSAAASFPS